MSQKKRQNKRKRNKLVVEHLYMVKFVLNKLLPQIGLRVDYDDLHSAAVIGLINAAKRFDPDKGYMFKTFAKYYIRGAILDELRSHDMMSRTTRDKYRKLERILERLEHSLGRSPTQEEVSTELKMPFEDYINMLSDIATINMVSTEEHKDDGNGNYVCVGDLLSNTDDNNNPQTVAINMQTVNNVLSAIRELPECDRLYLLLHFSEHLTMKEIGDLVNFHESRISQRISISISLIKEKLETIHQ